MFCLVVLFTHLGEHMTQLFYDTGDEVELWFEETGIA